MATESATSGSAPTNREAERIIERRLKKTRLQVRLVDLAGALMALGAGVIAALLVLAVVDHWLFGLSPWMRWLAWSGLFVAAAYYTIRHVLPLLVKPINPVYAAKAIEEAEPSLKNSLINFLLFRQHRGSLHEVVYSAMENQAATDLNHVSVENAVDRTKVIYIGYVLAGVLALGAMYKILSPKDPFQSVSRVAAPWAEIDRPSRVQIHDVQPGDAKLFQGESVSVSARIQGSTDSVTLYYSTADGEIVERPVPMLLGSSGLRHGCTLPPDDAGLKQEVLYRIEAGDARTSTYRLDVSPAPNIIVNKLEYDFAEYTGRADRTIEGQGDIKAVEGTRVTIRAKANQPIRSAFLEMDPVDSGDQTQAERLPIEFTGREAWRTIALKLEADRKTPQHASYQVRFVTPTGHENQHPVLHRIEVTPDLAPEVEILSPAKEVVEVPVNGTETIEVRAVDPDYGLTTIGLRGVIGGTELFSEQLLHDQDGVLGQAVKKYAFRPSGFDLEPGDRVVYRASAEDNRVEPGGSSPQPNRSRTKEYQLLIVPAKEGSGSGAESAGASDRTSDDMKNESEEASSGEEESAGESDNKDSESGKSGSEASESGSGKEESGGSEGEQQSGGDGQNSESGSSGKESEQKGANASTNGGQSQAGQNEGGGQPGGNTPRQSAGGGKPGDGEPGDGAQPSEQEPLHDGEVFEKALERLKQQTQQTGNRGKGRSASGDPQGDTGDKQDVDSASGSDNSAQGNSTGDSGTSRSDPKRQMGDEKPSSKQQASDPQSPQEGARHGDDNLGAGAQQQAAPGAGATNKKEGEPTGKNGAEPDRGENPPPPGPKDMRKKTPGSGDTGDAGAGQNSKDPQGTPAVDGAEQGANRDRQKTQQPDSSQPQPNEPPVGSTSSKKQSDSKGESTGDRSGGGKKGRGQGANQAGNDSAGQNSAADEGAGKATEAGQGETSGSAGTKERAEGQTGVSGNETGNGSGSQSDPSGKPSDSGGEKPQPVKPQERKEHSPEEAADSTKSGAKSGGSGVATGGGLPSDVDTPAELEKYLDVPPGDEANLEYARRATNLVLDYLKDQSEDPDRKLLDDLGFTEQELADFVKRWEELKRTAAEDPVGERELSESLRSLGLRPARDRVRQGASRSDAVRGLRDSGSRTVPPPGYEDLINAFKKGTARSSN